MAEAPDDRENTGKKDDCDISDEDLEKMLDDIEYLMSKSFCCGK
ncbi:MAG: hypothetical protein ACFFCS_21310 [Candidatus Hodarchaeota archaeon]